ncbi:MULTISPECIES: ABC transporter permease [unclassified Mesorhizobium]|uniref:ABC transporter permease n=1 Tax=unclassified Mesorhizobium TaxID=325217 RepID=UPI0003CF5B2D|nr:MULTISPECIES: ABC transporter permease [unclassified Mesorhizobium]ESX27555.1 ABC transporter permease [Mesorhizobium sp. LSHC440B00]ESX30145.1 ABC transporter permease [Mesorhizobium sp. LSHC440A00]ESX37693.1 ABC transporter permease [Mesorhizobium sp. LSHC432A00]WJI57253.1 ABC transporter permease [Mesorhizobium sp. C432A]
MQIDIFLQSIVTLANAAFLTIALTVPSLVIGFVISVPLAFMRASDSRYLSSAILAYTYVVRGTPLLVQLFLIYYGLGQIDVIRHSPLWVLLRDPFWCALLAFSLNSAAYTTELFRGAIQAVPRGLVEAAAAVGMSRLQQARLITFPIAFRAALPSYTNEVIGLLKASSLASTVTLLEITGVARRLVSETFAPYEIFLAAGVIYLALTYLVTSIFRLLERHLAGAKPKVARETAMLSLRRISP